jgi:hypothetical protein
MIYVIQANPSIVADVPDSVRHSLKYDNAAKFRRNNSLKYSDEYVPVGHGKQWCRLIKRWLHEHYNTCMPTREELHKLVDWQKICAASYARSTMSPAFHAATQSPE